MREEDWGSRWVGCYISWWNPCTFVRDSSCVPSVVVLSLVHQAEDLALKPPKTIVSKPLLEVNLKVSQNSKENFQIQ